MDWVYDGPYHVLDGARRGGRPIPGEIHQHAMPDGTPSGAYKLRCPICGTTTHIVSEQLGPIEAPTFKDVLKCGCKVRCGEYFRIRSGRAEAAEPEPHVPTVIPDDLAEAGVKLPPKEWIVRE